MSWNQKYFWRIVHLKSFWVLSVGLFLFQLSFASQTVVFRNLTSNERAFQQFLSSQPGKISAVDFFSRRSLSVHESSLIDLCLEAIAAERKGGDLSSEGVPGSNPKNDTNLSSCQSAISLILSQPLSSEVKESLLALAKILSSRNISVEPKEILSVSATSAFATPSPKLKNSNDADRILMTTLITKKMTSFLKKSGLSDAVLFVDGNKFSALANLAISINERHQWVVLTNSTLPIISFGKFEEFESHLESYTNLLPLSGTCEDFSLNSNSISKFPFLNEFEQTARPIQLEAFFDENCVKPFRISPLIQGIKSETLSESFKELNKIPAGNRSDSWILPTVAVSVALIATSLSGKKLAFKWGF